MEKREIKIKHNRKLFLVIIVLIILLVILIWFIVDNSGKKKYYFLNNDKCLEVSEFPDKITFSHYEKLEDCQKLIISRECQTDSDCVPAECCHSDSCVNIAKKPDCSERLCTMVCSGPLDCGAGYCGCVNNKCEVVNN